MEFLSHKAFLDRVGALAHRTALECEVIEKTGWAPEVVDRVATGRLERYVMYWTAQAERRRRDLEK